MILGIFEMQFESVNNSFSRPVFCHYFHKVCFHWDLTSITPYPYCSNKLSNPLSGILFLLHTLIKYAKFKTGHSLYQGINAQR